MNPKAIFELVRDTFKEWSEDKAARLGASLAYYTIFSIGPLLLISVSIAGLFFGEEAVRGQVTDTIGGLVGTDAAKEIENIIAGANREQGSIIGTAIGLVTLLLGASGVFGQLKDALNTIWEVKPKPGRGIMATIRERFFSFTMVLGTGFLLLASLLISALLSALGSFLSGMFPGGDFLWQILNLIISIAVIAVMFALLFRFLPDVRISWSDVWIGAIVTSVLFTVGQFALGLYLGKSDFTSTFGAAGSLVIVLVWIYYSSQILFLGAEFTQVYTNRYGSRVRPEAHAEFITEEQRAQEGAPKKEATPTTKESSEKKTGLRLRRSPWFS